MLTYSFEHIGSAALYEHLYLCIKNDISKGILQAGEHLPSKRSFAKNLGVSTITVENAYAQLISEGYVYALPKRGYFVADISEITKLKPVLQVPDIQLPQSSPEYYVDLSSNQNNPNNFPFSIWAKLMRETISEKRSELMINAPCGGILLLKEAIAEHLKSFRGMSVNPDQIIVGAGTEYLYGMLVQLFGKGKIYCVENPGYQKIAQVYKSNCVDYRFADIDRKGLTVQGLKEADADIVHICPTHHFPTGITMPVDRRYELLAWANENDRRYIIEDDYYSEFRLDGKPIPSLQSIDVSEKVVYMNTFSKSLASTIRISYMVLPVHLVNLFYRNMSFYSCTVSNFEQYTLAKFIKEGYFEKHINRMRLFYTRQRKQVLECIQKSSLNNRCKIFEEDSGLNFLLYLKSELSDKELSRRFTEKQIHLASLSEYYQNPDKASEHIFILNYSNLDLHKLNAALEIISQSI